MSLLTIFFNQIKFFSLILEFTDVHSRKISLLLYPLTELVEDILVVFRLLDSKLKTLLSLSMMFLFLLMSLIFFVSLFFLLL
jgi:hypothetical protein